MAGSEENIASRFQRSQDHHEAYLRLIRWELEDELAMTEERLRNWSDKKLEANGIALFGLSAKADGWLFGQRVIRFRRGAGRGLGSHRFRQGDIIMLSRSNPLTEKPIEAVVSNRSRDSIRVVVPEAPKGLRKGTWRIDRGANRVAFDRMRDALNSIFEEGGGAPLRELLLGLVHDPEATASLIPEMKGAKEVRVPLPSDLNESQREAAKMGISRRLTLIQGPPGTGKTHTAVRILENWAIQDTGTVLAVADSNVAVDNLLEGLLERGIRAVRLGQPVKVRESLREATMDARMESHELNRDLIEEIERNEKLSRRIKGMRGGKEKGLAHRDLSRGWKEVRRLERQIRDDILDRAQVLCCTCIGSGHDLLDGRSFSRVLIDEATQATEPASLVPLVKGSRQIVLVGDHRQLPPTVISRRAEKGGLDRSLFERLVEMGIAPLMLTTQYRMHPSISDFPNKRFYDGKLEDGVDKSDRAAPAGMLEASWVVKILMGLIEEGGLEFQDIGIVTPYAGQVRAIRDMIPESMQDVEVRTVDGYQGREKDVIIFSSVRSNPDGNVGFLSDGRRLNVALTRSRRGLIVVGNPETLRHDDNWRAWIDHIRSSKLEAWHLLGTA